MDLPFLKLHPENVDAEEPDEYLFADRTMPMATFGDDGGFDGGFGVEDAGFGGDFHAATDADFGAGGDNWADQSVIGETNHTNVQGFEPLKDIKRGEPGKFIMALSGQEGENILSYFDEKGGKNWAGPEHWRIQRIKKGTHT